MAYRQFSPPATVTNSAAALFSSPSAHAPTSHQPAEVFRKDLISAMKLPDSHQLQQEDFMYITDTWKMEWEKGVQVPVAIDSIPPIKCEELREPPAGTFKLPKKFIQVGESAAAIEALDSSVCQYDLDDVDLHWLNLINTERDEMGDGPIEESKMEEIIEEIEAQCHKNMEHIMATEDGLGIEYDEDVICDVCRAPDCEEGNEMVFCDNCDICVHQACYGILKIPEGNWMCRTCALGIQPSCLLCGIKGGAMKSTRSGTKWAHVSCALWIPEVSFQCVERMEPITKISQIPASRWALICKICRVRTGACIQCSVRTCKVAYHVTCGFENNLEMKTFLDDNVEVRFKSFCMKHSKKKQVDGFIGENTIDMTPQRSPVSTPKKEKTNEEKANERAMKIQFVTEEFYKYVKAKEVAATLGVKDDPTDMIDQVFEYWKLKRKAGFNKPLVASQKEEVSITGNEEYNLHARMRMFVHLRQDLERVRNLCYMVQKREKLAKQMYLLRQGIFYKQCDLFNGDTSNYTEEELSFAHRAVELSAGNRNRNTTDDTTRLTEISGEDKLAAKIKPEPKDEDSDRSSTSSGSRDSSPDSSSRSGSSAHSGSERSSRESSPRSKSSKDDRGGQQGRDNNNSGSGDNGGGGNDVGSCPNEDGTSRIPTMSQADTCLAQNNNNNLMAGRHNGRNVKRKLSMSSGSSSPNTKRLQSNATTNRTFKSDYAQKFEEYLQSVANSKTESKRTTRLSASGTLESDTRGSTLREMQVIAEADKVHAQLIAASPKVRKSRRHQKSESDTEFVCLSPPRPQSLALSNLQPVTPTQDDQRSCQSTPETRSARKRIEEELDRESVGSDRQFENVDEDISIVLDSNHENTKDGRESPLLKSPLVSRITRHSKPLSPQQTVQGAANRRNRLSLRRSENSDQSIKSKPVQPVNGEVDGAGKKYSIRSRLTDVAYRVFNSTLSSL